MKLRLVMNSFATGVCATATLVCILKQNFSGATICTFFTIINGIFTYFNAKELKEVE